MLFGVAVMDIVAFIIIIIIIKHLLSAHYFSHLSKALQTYTANQANHLPRLPSQTSPLLIYPISETRPTNHHTYVCQELF